MSERPVTPLGLPSLLRIPGQGRWQEVAVICGSRRAHALEDPSGPRLESNLSSITCPRVALGGVLQGCSLPGQPPG